MQRLAAEPWETAVIQGATAHSLLLQQETAPW